MLTKVCIDWPSILTSRSKGGPRSPKYASDLVAANVVSRRCEENDGREVFAKFDGERCSIDSKVGTTWFFLQLGFS